jgi:predicted RNA-binding Zn-ribbon protein involved in translation (DUF1610 family)
MKYVHFGCPHCGVVSKAGEWNGETIKLCTDDKSKKSFMRIQDAGQQNRWYKCPVCKKPSKLNEIKPTLASEVAAMKEDAT